MPKSGVARGEREAGLQDLRRERSGRCPSNRGDTEDATVVAARRHGKEEVSGTIEVVIDENGSVASAAVTTPVYPSYDQRLLQAARSWRYKPARKGGQPVNTAGPWR